MKIKHYIAAILCLGILAACNSSNSEDTTTTPTTLSVLPAKDTTPVVNTPVTNPTVQAPVVNTGTQQLNPAHGQPGHRCDIAEGAPLNSAPAKAATTTVPAVQPQNVSVTPTSVPIATPTVSPASSSALNPAHGQPGHRCDIAVGAPLNSKPTTQPETVVQQLPLSPATEIKATPIVTPAAPVKTEAAAPAATTTAPGMNPAHGQPGHRCDIAVGAPLNSAPKKD
jgi:uncharacterized protein YvpB